MILSLRLQNIADIVSSDSIVADIGSDHGLLPISLVVNKRTKKTYAMDIAIKPLNQAKDNIMKYDVGNSVYPILSDGLENLPDDVNTLVFSGMGSKTIINIISKDISKLKNISEIIMEPNIGSYDIREFMSSLNYSIVFEKTILENDVYYDIIKCSLGKQELTTREKLFGPYNLKHIDINFINKWTLIRKKMVSLVRKIPESSPQKNKFIEELSLIDEILKTTID